jgi:thioredoxin-dependent peroxiredoxin
MDLLSGFCPARIAAVAAWLSRAALGKGEPDSSRKAGDRLLEANETDLRDFGHFCAVPRASSSVILCRLTHRPERRSRRFSVWSIQPASFLGWACPVGARLALELASRPMIQASGQAPDFELPDQNGDPVKLSDLKGQTVVLYFYPRADTPGCTTQACGVRDRGAEYASAGVRVIGVSPDPVDAVKKFANKFDLEFTLLADADHAVAEAYGTWVEKSMYGKKYMGVQRATFIVDADGKIAKVFPKVSPKTHDDVVLKALGELAAA